MTVKQLIERLEEEDPEAIIIMSKDSEGNSYRPIGNIAGNFLYEKAYLDIVSMDEADGKEGQKALVFWPE